MERFSRLVATGVRNRVWRVLWVLVVLGTTAVGLTAPSDTDLP